MILHQLFTYKMSNEHFHLLIDGLFCLGFFSLLKTTEDKKSK